jgi:hypothetical protein
MKTFCIEFYHSVCVDVMAELHAKHGIEPLLWTSSHLHEKAVNEKFPDAHFFHGGDAKMAKWPASLQWCEHAPFDGACQHVWNTWHHQIFDMLRRWDYCGDYTQLEMSQDFYEQLVAWNHLLVALKPDFIFLWEPPHVQYSLMLYALAKYHGIKALCIVPTQGAFSSVSDDFSGGRVWNNGLRLAQWEQQAGYEPKEEDLHDEMIAVFRRATNKSYSEGIPWWQRNYLQLKSGSVNFTFIRKIWHMMRGHLKRDFRRFRKGEDKSAVSPVQGIYPHKESGLRVRDSFIGRFVWLRYGRLALRNYLETMKHERAYLATVSKEPSQEGKYVLVCFSFQPELTSNPLGGIFLHQWLMANIVAHSVPDDCETWVKEHPAQFVSLGGTSSYRNTLYYDLIRRLPRVKMVPLHADQFDLIDNSLAVATLTGTVGFEALARGKQVLIFGSVWYDRCQNVHKVADLASCREAMRLITTGSLPAAPSMPLALKELELTAFRFGSEASLIGTGQKTTQENIADLVDQVALVLGLHATHDPEMVRFSELLDSPKPSPPHYD